MATHHTHNEGTIYQRPDGRWCAGATLGETMAKWLETARTSVRPKTWKQCTQIVNQHVLPDLGNIRLKDLRPDLNWDNATLQVQRQLQTISGQGTVFGGPKSAAGRRMVTLGSAELDRLRGHRERQYVRRLFAGERRQEQGLVFPSSAGTPMEAPNLLRNFKRML